MGERRAAVVRERAKHRVEREGGGAGLVGGAGDGQVVGDADQAVGAPAHRPGPAPKRSREFPGDPPARVDREQLQRGVAPRRLRAGGDPDQAVGERLPLEEDGPEEKRLQAEGHQPAELRGRALERSGDGEQDGQDQ